MLNRSSCCCVVILLAIFISLGIQGNNELACTLKENNISAAAQFSNYTYSEITEPQFPVFHIPTNCTWRIGAAPFRRVKLVITSLQLSDPRDYVIINDGPSLRSPVLGNYGPCAKGSVTLYSGNTNLHVHLVTHGKGAVGKLRILFKALPESYITCRSDPLLQSSDYCPLKYAKYAAIQSGSMTSPGFPAPSLSKRCIWSVTAPPGHRIQLAFHWMGLQCQDSISFNDPLKRFCGCDELPVVVSRGRNLWIRLESRKTRQAGFWFTYKAVSLQECPSDRSDCPVSYRPQGFDRTGNICTDITDVLPTTPPLTTTPTTNTPTTPIKVATTKDTRTTISPVITVKQETTVTKAASIPTTTTTVKVTTKATEITAVSGAGTSRSTQETTQGATTTTINKVSTQSPEMTTKPSAGTPSTAGPTTFTQRKEDQTTVERSTKPPVATTDTKVLDPTVSPTKPVSQTTQTQPSGRQPSTTSAAASTKSTVAGSTKATTASYDNAGREGGGTSDTSKGTTTESRAQSTRVPATGKSDDGVDGEGGTDKTDVQNMEGRKDSTNGVDVRTKGVKVVCNKNHIEVTLLLKQFEGLSLKSLHLRNSSCKTRYHNDTHAVFRVPLDGCGTAHNSTADHITYYNVISGESVDMEHQMITRNYEARFSFDCSYAKRRTLSVVSFSSRRKIAIPLRADNRGNFTYLMDLYTSDRYRYPYDEYPVSLTIGQRMYAQVVVKAHKSLVIFLDTCSATPTSNYDDPISYRFIDNGCPRDNSMRYDYKMSAVQQFSISSFRFTNITASSPVFLHCLVYVCPRSDNATRCERGCADRERRLPRAVGRNAPSDLEVLTLGPINLIDSQSDYAITHNENDQVLAVGVCVALLGVVAVVLIVAVVIVTKRRRQTISQHTIYISIAEPRD